MLKRTRSLVLPLFFALISVGAHAAEDTTLNTPSSDHSDQNGWGGGAEMNANISKGNTNIETLGAAAEVDFKAVPFNTSLKGSYMRNRTDNIERARMIHGSLRTGFNITNNLDFFALGSFMQDRFRGIEHEWMATPGLGIYAVNSDMLSIRFEGGAGFLNEEYFPFTDTSRTFGVGTAGMGFRLKISDTADLTDDILWVDPFNDGSDWRINNVGAISSRMTKVLSLKVSQNTLYRKHAVASHNGTDNYTTAAIVLKF